MTKEQQQKVLDNEKLVYNVYYKYIYKTPEILAWEDDIIQEGFYGLCKAVLNYKEGLSNFSTFATIVIRSRMTTFLKRVVHDDAGVSSLDEEIQSTLNGDNTPLIELIVDPNVNVLEDLIEKEDISFIWDLLDAHTLNTKTILITCLVSSNLTEAADELGCTRASTSRVLLNFAEKCKKMLKLRDTFNEFPFEKDYISRDKYLKDLRRLIRKSSYNDFKRNKKYLKNS